ncbi:preprotein translocase subunit SecA [Candidatus Wolfebacteria bacterium]|nr:preprotein translocase subunit SecA [Candidatus Wolfebacteria bacterium]
MKLLNFLFDPTKELKKEVLEINSLEDEISALDMDAIKKASLDLKEKVKNGENLDTILPRAFALVREAAKKTLDQRHFDVQLMGGIAIHRGMIAEMSTGEGKTLASTCPVYLNALEGKGVHVITVNEYLAKRDAVWMGQIYYLLGMKVACLVHEGAFMYDPEYVPDRTDKERDEKGNFLVKEEYLRPITRKEAYQADITYGTNHEFGFDYLRDNLAHSKEQQVQSDRRNYAIIDEIDSVLIDEARTPLIISFPDTASSDYYKLFSKLVLTLNKEEDYLVDEKFRSIDILETGIDKIEKALKITNIYSPENLRLTHYLNESLKSHALFKKDKDYVVKDDQIILVDQNTGRLMRGRRYSGGLHQAIEAKEKVTVQQESRTYAQITIQNYFRLYKKLAGMTGTAQTSAEEFDKVYSLSVITIPTNKSIARKDLSDVVYKTTTAKYKAIAYHVKELQKKGQPVLIGTISIEKNEVLSHYLNQAGVKHEVLNAKNHEREGSIIAQAGRIGSVTVATNMAGRGVDIVLGGNPFSEEESKKVKELGGLNVIGTERHDARRIDNQLRGRSGRQGDPGESRFYLSLEDDLMRIFGGDRIKNLMESLDVPEDIPIESKMVSRAVSQAQARVEGFGFDARKHLLEYDDILNKQRLAIYEKREELLKDKSHPQILMALDTFWMNHLEAMEALRESVRLRAYSQKDPLVEYRRESHFLFKQLLSDFDKWVEQNKSRIEQLSNSPQPVINKSVNNYFKDKKVGRNDTCPCGSGKKYKKCHGS